MKREKPECCGTVSRSLRPARLSIVTKPRPFRAAPGAFTPCYDIAVYASAPGEFETAKDWLEHALGETAPAGWRITTASKPEK